jgi:hypothetical protein
MANANDSRSSERYRPGEQDPQPGFSLVTR